MNARTIWVMLLVLIAATSCSEDDDPTVEDGLTKVIGENIYRILQGDDQTGAPGQFLPLEIRIRITDLQGKPKFTNLRFETSDPGAEVIQGNYSASDTITVQWKLGCDDRHQTLTISDNVCGIARQGCVDVTIFEITAMSSGTPTGWFEACETFMVSSSSQIFSSDKMVTVVGSDRVYRTSDPVGGDWFTASLPQNIGYSGVKILSGGEMYYRKGNTYHVSLDQGQTWSSARTPTHYGDTQLTFLENGNFIYAEEYREIYISSDKGNTWDLLIDISEATAGQSYEVQSIAARGNTLFVVAQNNKVIEIEGDRINVHDFVHNSWPAWGDMASSFAEVVDDRIFFNYNRHTLYVLDLKDNNVTNSQSLDYGQRMIRSSKDIYIVNKTTQYRKYENGAFRSKDFTLPTGMQNNYWSIIELTFHQGSPVFINSFGKLYYFIN